MKTQEQILEKIRSEQDDFFGVKHGNWVEFLEYPSAKEFLKEEVKSKDWKPKENTLESIKKCITDYLPFAWEKANDMRGLSANRSINHMESYLWLLGDEELQKKFDDTKYEHYGKEKLIVVSEAIGFDWKKHDNGERTNG